MENFEQFPALPAPRNPNCLTASIESICVRRGWCQDLSLIHAHHGFQYLRQPFAATSLTAENPPLKELQISSAWPYTFSRSGIGGDVLDRLRRYYGISLIIEELTEPAELVANSLLQVGSLVAVDPYYVQGRKEWNLRHSLIFVVVNGLDRENGQVAILEQNVGQLFISIDDFVRSLYTTADLQGYSHRYILTRDAPLEAWSIDDLRLCLRNALMTGGEDTVAQLKAFVDDYIQVTHSGAIPTVPAAWKFFGERYSFARYLDSISSRLSTYMREVVHPLSTTLVRSGAGWETFSRFQTALESTFDQRLLKRQVALLQMIEKEEGQIAEIIERSYHTLDSIQA
ncbi:MAG: hypothetical protein PHP57_13550 [Sideroxydans sp.]|nr:hypothetical protein [Sideroxydans sp.]